MLDALAHLGTVTLRRRARDVRLTAALGVVMVAVAVLPPLFGVGPWRPWVLALAVLIPAACALDWWLLRARLHAGTWGSNAMEAREAVEAMLAERCQRRRGRGRDA